MADNKKNEGQELPEKNKLDNIVKKNLGGRPSSYESLKISTKLEQVKEWKLNGATNKQIAKNLGISVSSFCEYLNKYPEFRQAIEKGKEVMADEIENALFKSAVGYNYIKKIPFKAKKIIYDPETNKKISETEEIIYGETEEHVPPQAIPGIFMIKNLMPDKYKDKIEHEQNININVNKLDALTNDDLLKIIQNSESLLKNAGFVEVDYEVLD